MKDVYAWIGNREYMNVVPVAYPHRSDPARAMVFSLERDR